MFTLLVIRFPLSLITRARTLLTRPPPPPQPALPAYETPSSTRAELCELLSTHSAIELATLIADASSPVTSVGLVEAAHSALATPPVSSLNAVVAFRPYEEALAEAWQVDTRVAAGLSSSLPEFAGVPTTIKECFAVQGMPHTSGVAAREGVVASADAPVVAGLKDAGFVVLGVTNVSEACMWWEAHNGLYGATGNPYDPRRTCGGSSGGEAAVVGAGVMLVGCTSDVGGSTRMPAVFNGVFGHKPSPGLVPNGGQYPLGDGETQHILATGPVARSVDDLLPMLRAMSSPAARSAAETDPDSAHLWKAWRASPPYAPLPEGPLPPVDFTRLRVISCTTRPFPIPGVVSRLSPPAADAHAAAVDALASLGATVERKEYPEFARALEMWSAKMAGARTTRFRDLIGVPEEDYILSHLLECVLGLSHHTFPALMLALTEDVGSWFPESSAAATARADEVSEALQRELDTGGAQYDASVLVFPSFPTVAPYKGYTVFAPLDWVYTALFNVLKLPVTQVPMGLDERTGMPVGVQVVVARGRDVLGLGVAKGLVEVGVGGWVPPRR